MIRKKLNFLFHENSTALSNRAFGCEGSLWVPVEVEDLQQPGRGLETSNDLHSSDMLQKENGPSTTFAFIADHCAHDRVP